jgi:hypothetical protein
MTSCARCTVTREPAIDGSASPAALCAEHALAVLDDIRRHLAARLTSLERATDRAAFVVASGSGG